MRAAVNGHATRLWAAVLVSVGGVGLLAGCDSDTHQADKEAQAKIDEAMVNRRIGGDQGNGAAKQALQAAVADQNISSATKIHAKSMLAQINVDAATELMRRIDHEEQELSRTAFELSQLAMQLDAGAILVTDYSKYDPKTAREQIQAKIAEAQGGPDKPAWFTHETSVIPTDSAVKQKISELQTQLAKLQDDAKSLDQQRGTTMQQAQEAMAAAEGLKGKEGIEKFKEASGLQRKAGDMATQLDQVKAQMIPIENQLAVAQAQQQVLSDVIKQLQAELDALDTGWKAMQEHMNAQVQLARQIVGSEAGVSTQPPTTGPSMTPADITAKAALIKRKADELRAMRSEAQSDLDDAAKLFGDARGSAEELRTTTEQRLGQIAGDNIEKKSWEALKNVLNAQYYQLREATAKRMLGALYASDASSLLNRSNLEAAVVPVIERAGASVPAELRPGDLTKNFKESIAQADEAYKSANELLDNVTSGASPKEVKDAATVEKVLTLYGLAQVEKMNGDPTAAKGHIDEAIALRNNAVTEGVHVPAMPAELGPPPLPPGAVEPTTAPTTEPTTAPTEGGEGAPATQPAEGAAPATAPGEGATPAAPPAGEGGTPPATNPG